MATEIFSQHLLNSKAQLKVICIILFIFFLITISSASESETESKNDGKNKTTPSISNANVDSSIANITVDPLLDQLDLNFSLCQGIDIRELNISHLHALYHTGKLTALALTQCYLERIYRLNPVLRAVIEVNPDALRIAAKLDKAWNAGTVIGPLHGVPILIKDGIGTADKMENTAGSLALLGIKPKRDADVVSALRKAGAIILGKANLSEFYWFRGTNVPNAWSGRGGQTRSAYHLNKSPEGSSSGSAVSVSANLCMLSLGTETDGSLMVPSSLGAVVAMKPTFDLVSTKGMIPLTRNQDHLGAIARSASDLSYLLDAIIPHPKRHTEALFSFTHYISEQLPGRLRIGVLRQPFWNNTLLNSSDLVEKMPKLENILNLMNSSEEFEILDPVELTTIELLKNVSSTKEQIMFIHDLKNDFNDYLANEVIYPSSFSENAALFAHTKNNVSSLQEVIRYYQEHPTPEGFDVLRLSDAQDTDGITNQTYTQARDDNRAAAKRLLDDVLGKHNLDAVIAPTFYDVDVGTDENLQDSPLEAFSIACISGYPSVTVPAGIDDQGMPFGVMFIGNPHTEHVLLKIAYQLENLAKHRKPPQFRIK